jgi:LuxR family maltose regulon positive regulatory protein
MGLRLTPNEISLVDSRTEGWIASLQMAALAWKGKDSLQDAIASFSGSHKYVLDFLLDEVWRRQPEPVQTFLMRTAVLERLSAPLCDAVTGGEDGDGMLDLINRENLFLVNLDDDRRWYRYHPLFAEFLARQLVSKMADVVGTLHERAARWYEKNQLLPMAVHHAMVAGDSGEYARLIGMAANEALTNGRLNLISSWLERIPEETIRSHHQLALTRATVLYMTGKNELAQDYIRAAAAAIDPEASQNDIARLFSVRAFVCFSLGEIVDGIRWANEAVNLVDESDNNLRADLCFNLAQARWVSGDLEGAVQSCRQAIAYGEASDNKFITCSAQGALLQIMRSQGRLAESISLGREMVRLQVDGQGEPLPVAGYIHVCLAQAEYETNALAEATDDVKRGIALCRQMGDHHTIVIAKILLARLHLANGEAGEALTTVRAIRPEANYMRFAKQLAALEVDIEMGRGNLTPADSWAKSIESFASSPSHHFMIPIYLTYARWLLARDQGVNAAALLAKLADMAQEGGWHRYMAPIIILQAIVSRSLGREELSLSLLAESVASAAPRRHKRPFLDELPRIRNQLKRVRDSAPEFVDSLLSTTSGRSNASAMDELIEPLNERETQILRLMAAGLSNPAIARELFLTVNTVKWYVKSLYQKLDVHNRMEAVSRARAIGRL